jgi:hypothetical protein
MLNMIHQPMRSYPAGQSKALCSRCHPDWTLGEFLVKCREARLELSCWHCIQGGECRTSCRSYDHSNNPCIEIMNCQRHGGRSHHTYVPHEQIKTNSPAADRRFNGKDGLVDLV